MSKNTYEKEQVWGTVGVIVFIVILGLFIGREIAQDNQIMLLTESNLQLKESQDIINERLSNFDFVPMNTFEAEQKRVDGRLGGIWGSITSAHEDIFELDQKLGDRIPNWNKR